VSFSASLPHRSLHSFPTRRSSDLLAVTDDDGAYAFKDVSPGDYVLEIKANGFSGYASSEIHVRRGQSTMQDVKLSIETVSESVRSEEHTSELQSLRHLVCRLLLEK